MLLRHCLLRLLRLFLRLLKLPLSFFQSLLLRCRAFLSKSGRALLYLCAPPDSRNGGEHQDPDPPFSGCQAPIDYTVDMISASTIPLNVLEAGLGRAHYPPARPGSSSYANLRQTLASMQGAEHPRVRATSLPLPVDVSRASSLHLPDNHNGVSVSPTLSHMPMPHDTDEMAATDEARVRAEFIEAGVVKEHRVGLELPSTSSAAHSPPSTSSSRIPLTPSNTSLGFRAYMPDKVSAGSRSASSSSYPVPSIRLEPPAPDRERCSSARTFSDIIGVNVQHPSLESLHTIHGRHLSPSPTPSDSRHSRVSRCDSTMPVAAEVPDVPPGHTLKEMIPSDGPRYNRQTFVEDEHYTFEVPPLCLNFPQGDPYDDWNDPDLHGWEPHTHPEGSLYFYHREKRIFTEAYIYLPSYLEEVEQLVAYLQQLSQAQPAAPLPADYELVVQITFDKSEVTGEKGILWQYYYVDHKTRGLFWLRPFEVGEHLIAVCGEVFPAHFKHMLETWYWDHVALFPDNFESHDYLVEEVIGHLTFFGIDVMTASTTTVQYSLKEVTNMIQLLGTKEPGAGAVPIAAALGRIMADFCHWRFLHYHGQRWARLSRLESARKSTIRVSHSTRTWTMKLFFVLFLHAPEGHIRDIEKVFVDGLVTAYAWKRYITKLRGEWEELVTYAAIMLTASVSMLSVPDVILFPDDSNSPGGDSGIQSYLTPIRSPAAIANYVAIICSIGSVVTGLILLRNNRSRHDDDLPEAVDYMRQQRSPRYHFEPLAILYSAPYALLMWAMLSFSASVLIFTLVKTDIATQSTVVVMSSVVAALVAWCIARFIDIWEWDVWKRAVELCRTAMKRLRLRRLGCSLRENGLSNTPENAASSPSGTLGHVSRIHWCSLTKKMRQTKIPCINDV